MKPLPAVAKAGCRGFAFAAAVRHARAPAVCREALGNAQWPACCA